MERNIIHKTMFTAVIMSMDSTIYSVWLKSATNKYKSNKDFSETDLTCIQ